MGLFFRQNQRFGRTAFLEDMENAKRGNVHAMVNVGLAYWRGDGVLRDFDEAQHWLSRAAELGDPNAGRILEELLSNPEKELSGFGCGLWLPIIPLVICGLIVGMPQNATTGGFLAYVVILNLNYVYMFSCAIGTGKNGLKRRAKIYVIGGVVYMVLMLYILFLPYYSNNGI